MNFTEGMSLKIFTDMIDFNLQVVSLVKGKSISFFCTLWSRVSIVAPRHNSPLVPEEPRLGSVSSFHKNRDMAEK